MNRFCIHQVICHSSLTYRVHSSEDLFTSRENAYQKTPLTSRTASGAAWLSTYRDGVPPAEAVPGDWPSHHAVMRGEGLIIFAGRKAFIAEPGVCELYTVAKANDHFNTMRAAERCGKETRAHRPEGGAGKQSQRLRAIIRSTHQNSPMPIRKSPTLATPGTPHGMGMQSPSHHNGEFHPTSTYSISSPL